jgi:hypothetical protein
MANIKKNANIENANGSTPVPMSTPNEHIHKNVAPIVIANLHQAHGDILNGGSSGSVGVAGWLASVSTWSLVGVELRRSAEEE